MAADGWKASGPEGEGLEDDERLESRQDLDEDTLPLQPTDPPPANVCIKRDPERHLDTQSDSARSTDTNTDSGASKASLAKRQAQKSWANAVRGTKFRRQFDSTKAVRIRIEKPNVRTT
eukprot:5875865-Amphidinium_carterae.1